jgi:two-component system invasion response regulator UvrY
MDGFQALSEILAREPKARILILSHHEEPSFAERTLAQGAAGYLGKGTAPELLYLAVREVAAGRRYLDPTIAQALVLNGGGNDGPLQRLSERELGVFLGLAEGRSVAELAEQLHISQNTVTTHYARIKRKLGVGNRTELTRLAIRHHLMEP